MKFNKTSLILICTIFVMGTLLALKVSNKKDNNNLKQTTNQKQKDKCSNITKTKPQNTKLINKSTNIVKVAAKDPLNKEQQLLNEIDNVYNEGDFLKICNVISCRNKTKRKIVPRTW